MAGVTQSLFLREFIAEIVSTGGAASAEEVAGIFKNAALEAAYGLFGAGTPISVELGAELGEVRVTQVLEVAEEVGDPRREVALAAVRAAGYAVEVGDSLEVPIHYTGDPREREAGEQTRAQLGAVLPLPVHSSELWVRLTAALNAVLLRYFPAPVHPEGSLGALLAGGGGWTRGCSARSGEYEVVLEEARLTFYRTRVTSGWVEYGFVTVVRKAGVEVFRGASERVWGRIGEAEDAPYVAALWRGDNDGVVDLWAGLPTSEAARPGFLAVLGAIADGLAGGELRGRDVDGLLVAAIRPPSADGLWMWMQAALPRLLTGTAVTTEHAGGTVRFEISEVYPPQVGLVHFGATAVRIVASTDDEAMLPNPEGEPLQLGYVGADALTLRGPDSEEERDLEAIVAAYRAWLQVHLAHHVAHRGYAGIEAPYYFYSFAGYFPLAQLLEQRLRWGPAGDPPVPAFAEAALVRAGQLLKRAEVAEARVLAAFTASGWTIRLHDDVNGRPFGSYCGISLVPPEGGEACEVMMVDAWNPEARKVIDGDAFAFRRFLEWLRAAVVRAGLDEVRVFEDGEEDEDDAEEASRELSLSDWLLFGLPDVGDRFLVDWRAQWHVVNAVVRVDEFAGIYGFTGACVERLRTRDVACWRRFLREVLDPRFAETTGERLLHQA